jgi:hypothetical protein
METKKCIGPCGLEKGIELFELRKDTGKRRNICQECIKVQKAEQYQTNRIEIRVKAKEKIATNPQANRDRVKRWKTKKKEERRPHLEEQMAHKKMEREELDKRMIESGVVGAVKLCTGPCGLKKSLGEFYYRKDTQKYRDECKECNQALKKARPKRIRIVESLRPGFKRCTGKCKQIKPEGEFRLRADSEKRRNECTICWDARVAAYHKEHVQEISQYHQKYAKENKVELRKKRAQRERNRKKKDLTYKFLSNLRCSIERAFKGRNRSIRTIEYLSCRIEEAIGYIESLWKPGMTWNNWSKNGWQLDHIIPIATIRSLDDVEQIRKVFHYTNLQPLWNEEHKMKTKKDLEYIRKLKQIKETGEQTDG